MAQPRGILIGYVAAVPVLLFLLGPVLVVLPMSLTSGDLLMFPPQGLSVRAYWDYFQDSAWLAATWNSLRIVVVATTIATVAGAGAAVGLHRSTLPFRGALTAIILLPLLMPVIVLALGDYLFFTRLGLTGSWISVGLAHSVLVTPYVFVAVQASLSGLDPSLPRAATSLGANAFAVFWHVVWPAIKPGVISGAFLAAVGSFDEVVVALFLSGASMTTLPVQMFTSLQIDMTPKVAAVSSLLFLLSLLVLTMQSVRTRRGPKASR